MAFQYTAWAIPLLLAGAMTIGLAGYSLRRRRRPEAFTFGIMMIALSLWTLLQMLSISGADYDTQYLFNRLKYVGVVAVPPLWLILALQCTGNPSVVTTRNTALLFLPAVALLPVVLTDNLTHAWWTETWIGAFGGRPVLLSTHGPAYFVHVIFTYLFSGWGLGLYVLFYRRTERIYRAQALLLTVAASVLLAANLITQLGFSPLPWGLDPFVFTASGVLVAIAIFRYRFLDIIPVARQAVLEQIAEGVLVVDARGRVVDVNPAARVLMDLGQRPLAGVPLGRAVTMPELRKILLEITHPGQDQPVVRDLVMLGPDNGRALSVSATPLVHAASGQIGQIVLVQDISERAAAQREMELLLRRAQLERERLALTITTVSDPIVLLDASGRILASNPSARRTLDAGPGEPLPPAIQGLLARARTASTLTQTEVEIGDQAFHAAVAPVGDLGWVVTLHDVTHIRQLGRLKDEFVSGVSHDLRTPLSSIMGYAEIARRTTTSPQIRQGALERIQTSAQRMSELVTNLLDLAMLEADVDRTMEPVALDDLARAAVENLEGAALSKGLEINLELDAHPPLAGDPRLLAQLWRNLIDNAIKYTNEGVITVCVRELDSHVLGQVSDTGIGIAPSELPFVFDKFYRAGHNASTAAEGTGLGLSLVKSIVEKHHGQVWAESEVGIGSSFTFTLPLQGELEGLTWVEAAHADPQIGHRRA